MNNNSRREERKLIFGTLLALFLIGFVLVYGVLTRQSYTDKERNGTLKRSRRNARSRWWKAAEHPGAIGMREKIPILRQVCGGLSRITTIPPGRAGPVHSVPIMVS